MELVETAVGGDFVAETLNLKSFRNYRLYVDTSKSLQPQFYFPSV